MDEMRIGSSDIVIPPLGVGVMAWSKSRSWGYGDHLGYQDVRDAFQECVSAGLRLFDTAEVYGWGQSERILGKLVQAEPTRVFVATKYAPLPYRFTSRSVRGALDKSLDRLGLQQVDLYQIHYPFTLWVELETLMEALARAVSDQKARYVGVSNFNAEQTRRAHAALARYGVPLVSNQVEYSLIQRAPERNGVLETCRELGITLIAYSPLGRGVLTGKYRPGEGARDLFRRFYQQFRGESLEKMQDLIHSMEEIGGRHGGKTPAQVALNWLIRQTGVFPIPGAKTALQVRESAGALGWEMSAEEAGHLDHLSRSLA